MFPKINLHIKDGMPCSTSKPMFWIQNLSNLAKNGIMCIKILISCHKSGWTNQHFINMKWCDVWRIGGISWVQWDHTMVISRKNTHIICNSQKGPLYFNLFGKRPWWEGPWGQHGAHLGPTGPRWAPWWPHESCYLGMSFVNTKSY